MPRPLGGRELDELPASVAIDFQSELTREARDRFVDWATLRVIPCDDAGRPLADAQPCPFRWYDASIPDPFPEFADAVSRTEGKLTPRPRERGGEWFNVLGDGRRGRLVFLHRQRGERPSWYRVEFGLLPEGTRPSRLPPRYWVGDGSPRCEPESTTTMGADHSRVDVADWDGDGRLDLIVGEQTGHVLWWPNVGTRQRPEFRYARFVECDGRPLDAGLAAAPKVVDWDGDGADDLLVGTHWNRLLFFRNVGDNRERRLEYRGPVTIDGEPLELPFAPLVRGSETIFRRDYYPVPEVADWDGDGDPDLLLGGYVTGRVYLCEQQGRTPEGLPRLAAPRPLEADGAPLNVGHWCAAPCVCDLDGDGDLDLLSGCMPMYVREGDADRGGELVQWYENVGGADSPRLAAARAAPGDGPWPHANQATPRAADWDGDGDLDLVVSAGRDIYLMENLGGPKEPRWQRNVRPLLVPWGLEGIAADRLLDWDGDGRVDLVRDYSVRLNTGAANPYAWGPAQSLLPQGSWIAHPANTGDDWFWPYLDDFDQDHKVDVLFGDWWGHVWLHRNQSRGKGDLADTQRVFDLEGVRLRVAPPTAGGEALIKVGPQGDPERAFEALQGARTVLAAADFDRDGRRDLVVGDTAGKVRYFRNVGPDPAAPQFAAPLEIGDVGIRCLVDTTDWDRDGWPDVIAGAANGRVRVYLNRQGRRAAGESPFREGLDPGLPSILQPRVLVGDLNGDGDEDLYLPSTQGSSFVERSFLEQGYARGELQPAP